MPFPDIDPVIFHIGPFALRWYALAYIAGLVGGWLYVRRLAASGLGGYTTQQIDDFLVWATLGVIIGGRLGYVLFYQPGYYLGAPHEILFLWQGGMAFHGGMLGVIVAIILFARHHGQDMLALGDMIACAAPIGLFFGRIANFINGELFGRPAPDLPWAVVFPHGGPVPRHPSQLYEALLEGLVLFIVLFALTRIPAIRKRPGVLGGVFLAGYGTARFAVEFYREPDAHIGFILGGLATMGQLLSLPMILAGLALVAWAWRRA